MARPREPIFCHSERRHFAKGLCEICYRKQQRDSYKNAVFALLGNRCNNPNCRYLNLDGTLGCTDIRLLHLDHINGGGRKERQILQTQTAMWRKVLKDEGKGYRLLCANCNWLHRYEKF